jgi:hypothetical protein
MGMRVHLGLITLIGVLLLVVVGSAALIPDQNSTITSNAANNWTVVMQQSTISVYAYNTTALIPVSGSTVTWSLNPTTLGSLGTPVSTTDASGLASTTFTAGATPGTVNITATIGAVQKTYTLNIDHDVPYTAVYNYQSVATVATVIPFNTTFTDRWGNPIDRRNPFNPQFITFTISSPLPNTAAFNINSTWVTLASLQPDMQGKISINVLTDSVYGSNIIGISPVHGYINGEPDRIDYQYIVSIENGVPFSIAQSVNPDSPPSLPADGASDHKFTITYSLLDKFGNPAGNQTIQVHTNFGDADTFLLTNNAGQIAFNYGPHTTAGNVTITATTLANSSVSCNCTIQYYSTAAVSMAFSASPETMPSIDANSTSTSTLSAKIMDVMGNPVAGQSVTFNIGPPTYDTPYVSSPPFLVNMTAVSDSNGYATVTFIPGGFNTTDNKYGLFNPGATGSTTATATWNSITKNDQLTWKNYPYLKITTSVSPKLVPLNGTVNVTISMLGDGWKLNGKPADVIIVTDLAGGILGTTLLGYTQTADNAFVLGANNTTWIGLVSFGAAPNMASTNATLLYANQQNNHNYALFNAYNGAPGDFCLRNPALWNSATDPVTIINGPPHGSGSYSGGSPYTYINGFSDATIDSTSFVNHQGELNGGKPLETAIANYQTRFLNTGTVAGSCGEPGCGGTDYAAGLNAALRFFAENPNPLHSQSIVIMGDGVTMMAPLAPGSMESYWPSDWYPRSNLGWLDESDTSINAAINAAAQAKSQGITIYAAGYQLNGYVDNSTLEQLVSPPYTNTYHYMASSQDLASTMLAIQGQIQQNAGVNTTMDMNFNNVSVGYGNQTTGFEYLYNPPSSTSITWQNGTTTVSDQSAQWNANHQLIFNVGTINLSQTWRTTFQLRATQQGIFDVCGNGSQVVFNNGADYENVSGCPVTVYSGPTNSGASQWKINITDLHVTQSPPFTNSVPLQWNITYPGNQTATEILWYSADNAHWNEGNSWSIGPGNWTETHSLDISSLVAGSYNYIGVQAEAPYTIGDWQSLTLGNDAGKNNSTYIKLE